VGIFFEKFNFSSELAQQRALFDNCFPENIGTSVQGNEHYYWKFHAGPFTPNSYEYVAKTEENEIIGYYAAIPYPYSINGITAPVGMVCDVMTGVKARGKGVFTQLGAYSTNQLGIEGIPFITGFPIRDEVIPGHLKIGWKIVFKLPLYIKFIKVNRLSFLKKIPLLSNIINFVLAFLAIPRNYTTRKYEVKIYDQAEVNSITGYDDFIERWNKDVTNHLIKTRKFLRWRLGAPEKKYKIIVIEVGKILQAMAITTFVIKEGIPSLAVLDFMVPEESKKYTKILHIEIEKLAKKMKAETVLLMISKIGAKKNKLLCNGFLKSPFSFSLIIKNLSNQFPEEQLFNPKNWSLMWIDSDDL
jgi:hypothetical protein